MPNFSHETVLSAPIDQVFDFLVQPENLSRISPPEAGLRFLDAPDRFSAGVEFQFAVQTFGMVQKITHRITEFASPLQFIEELVKGPLPKWIHTHDFVSVSENETRIIDHIEFEPPGGIVGIMLTENRIIEHMEDGLFYRHQQLEKFLVKAG
ncbi:MAG TPA: hypothetical protein DD473_22840 [Planctomycetaceae bacterium]|nr:hypothetical protein [Planctomycetaceae bacterium]